MDTYRIHKRYKGTAIEEVTSVEIKAKDENEAKEIAELNGFIVLEVNPLLKYAIVKA